jgi:ASC-1-like (ASCH) protein
VNYHRVILKKPYLDAILTGRKTIESRFTLTKRVPFGWISAGDKLFLKLSSGLVCATATVTSVKSFENLSPVEISRLKEQYNHYLGGGEEYWQSKSDCKFGLLVWLKDVRAIEPVKIDKKDWRAWVVLTEKENYGLLKMDG